MAEKVRKKQRQSQLNRRKGKLTALVLLEFNYIIMLPQIRSTMIYILMQTTLDDFLISRVQAFNDDFGSSNDN